MGNKTEFVRVADILIDTLDFDRDINVSVFETNIRGIQLLNKFYSQSSNQKLLYFMALELNYFYLVQLLVDYYLLIFCLDVLNLNWKKDGHVRGHCCGWLLMLPSGYYQVGS